MKAVFAVATSLLILVATWMIVAVAMYLLGWVLVRASPEGSLMQLSHVLLMWILSPAAGGYLAIVVTSSNFKTVPVATIFVGFVSVMSVVYVLLGLYGLTRFFAGLESGGTLVVLAAQAAAVILGSRIGKKLADARR